MCGGGGGQEEKLNDKKRVKEKKLRQVGHWKYIALMMFLALVISYVILYSVQVSNEGTLVLL